MSNEPQEPEAPEKVYVDARTLLVNSAKLARQVWDDGYRPNYIIGVWRGGTPPGVAIHEFFRLRGQEPYHTTMKTQSYAGMQRGGSGVEVKGLGHIIDVINAEDRVLPTAKTAINGTQSSIAFEIPDV